MLYLNNSNINEIGIDWDENIDVIEKSAKLLHQNKFVQPIKPYLRYGDMTNRIIAMPAYIGGDIEAAGIKWVASFPKNINKNIQRAHSVLILNEANTGVPIAIFNSGLLSGIRTAAVSGLMIKYFLKNRSLEKINIGIIGWGQIGKLHFQMVTNLLKEKIDNIFLFDLRKIDLNDIDTTWKNQIKICESWQDTYLETDIFMTCTVSKERYVDKAPKKGALLLNISLRDFQPEIYNHTKSIVVDDWSEVCRENTDIEAMHLKYGLKKEDTKSIAEVVVEEAIANFPVENAIMFNPMGMAIFDMSIANNYYKLAQEKRIGTTLEDY